MTAVDQLGQILADLGDTPDAVADRLRALGITGQQVSGCACPIALYLNQNGFSGASVNHLTALVKNPAGDFKTIEVAMPRPVSRFINRFDDGVYLDLVEVAHV